MHSAVIASTMIWGFVLVVMNLYATQNFSSLRPDPTTDLRLIPFFEGLAYISAVLLPFLALATCRHKYITPWCVVYIIFWIFALTLAIMDLVLVTNFDSLPITTTDGKLGGTYGNGLIAVSSLTLIFMFFSWIIPQQYWIVTVQETTFPQPATLETRRYIYY